MYYDKKAAWTASLSVIFCGVSIAVLQNKVVPCLGAIQAEFSLSNATGGWLKCHKKVGRYNMKKYRVGLIRVLTTDDPQLKQMHGALLCALSERIFHQILILPVRQRGMLLYPIGACLSSVKQTCDSIGKLHTKLSLSNRLTADHLYTVHSLLFPSCFNLNYFE